VVIFFVIFILLAT